MDTGLPIFKDGRLDTKSLRAMGAAYKQFRKVMDKQLEEASAFFDDERLYAWDELQAEGLLSLVHNVQVNPDYWLARRWAERVRKNNYEIASIIDFIEYCLDRVMVCYEKKSIQIMALNITTWAGYVDDLIRAWKQASA
ncbi:hypothetical protein HP570_20345 [Brevibacillus sp. RS1.1]|uniref:hypothetical protein n=1 Tax=Brevibacillus sp. RS1.1 TaxID=2738982 RepID=UPI00156B9D76|nr:hypothetical protein [Brevibacillus sp. RS1.1]NRR04568.1 hypothetical protein [Brevibacillus sp. RS1.1]